MSIFDFQSEMEQEVTKNEKQEKLDKALDQIRRKFGEDAIVRGSLKR